MGNSIFSQIPVLRNIFVISILLASFETVGIFDITQRNCNNCMIEVEHSPRQNFIVLSKRMHISMLTPVRPQSSPCSASNPAPVSPSRGPPAFNSTGRFAHLDARSTRSRSAPRRTSLSQWVLRWPQLNESPSPMSLSR